MRVACSLCAIQTDALMRAEVADISQALGVHVAVIAQQLVALTDDCFCAEVRAAASARGLRVWLCEVHWEDPTAWVINTGALDGLADAVRVGLAL